MAAAVACVSSPPASAGEQVFVNDDCHELIAVVPVPEDRVAGQLPNRFKPAVTGGMANVTVRTASCGRLGIAGRDLRPGLVAQLSVDIASPDGLQNVNGVPVCCSWYILFWVTNNRDVAAWLRQGMGLATKVQYVEDLSLTYDRATGGSYFFHAGPPAPSPFEIRAVASVPSPEENHIDFAYWTEKDGGAAKVFGAHDTLRFGTAAGEVLPQPGSSLSKLIGARAAFGPDPFASNAIGSGPELKGFLACGEVCFQ
jgi:hypothetical protein